MKPFSDENIHKITPMFKGELVEHLTSWLTINPVKGCPLSCAYCFRASWFPDEKPTHISSVEECMYALFNHPLFEKNITPISINISSTDALLPFVKGTTFEAIKKMEENEYKNPFIIISKLKLTNGEIDFLRGLRFVKPIFFSSFSLAPKHIEPVPYGPRIKNMANLKKAGIPTVLYFRPIVKGWNDSVETIEKALTTGQDYADVICIGGLRISPEIRSELLKVGEDLSALSDDFHIKAFNDEVENRIFEIYDKLGLSIPLYKRSSCAVSYLMQRANYNGLFKNPDKNCTITCPISQQKLCKSDDGKFTS